MTNLVYLSFLSESAWRKPMQEFTDYQKNDAFLSRNPRGDRVFPLESTRINEFELTHGKNAPEAFIHDGFFADELARSMHALAVTIGTGIYFRRSAYNPGSEEGRKLLAHELTHVSQHSEKRITKTVTGKELEEEAAAAELKEQPVRDRMMTVDIGGELFRFRESQMERITDIMAHEIAGWVKQLKNRLPEREYLSYLCAVDDWIEGR
jgi:hypothetical protein